MNTPEKIKSSWVTPTGRIGHQELAVGSGARPVGRYHHAPGNAWTEIGNWNLSKNKTTDVLRLITGDSSDDGDTQAGNSGAMNVDQRPKAGEKRSPTSPGCAPQLIKKKSVHKD